MNIKFIKTLTMIIVLFMLSTAVFAWRHGSPVTPYGDFCPRCSNYGVCKTVLSPEDSKKAIIDYYNKKGLDVEIVNIRGRFIKAKIKDEDIAVDEIIFDRRTGRIRSIY